MSKNIVEKYSKEELKQLMEQSSSFSDLVRRLGYKNYQSSNRNTVKKAIENYGLEEELSILKSKGAEKIIKTLKNASLTKKLEPKDVLVENSTTDRGTVKKIILRNNLIEYKCQKCGIQSIWLGEPLSLHLHHINGNNKDNRLENLCWLCPNCHSQTDNFGSKNSSLVKEKELQKQTERQKRDALKQDFIEERKKYFDSIDTTKWGWITKASKDLKTSRTQIVRWLKKNYPEKYIGS